MARKFYIEGIKAWGHVMMRDRSEDSRTRYLKKVRYHHSGAAGHWRNASWSCIFEKLPLGFMENKLKGLFGVCDFQRAF